MYLYQLREGVWVNREQVKQIALECGFKLKTQPDGTQDLNPYVYVFAERLIQTALEEDEREAILSLLGSIDEALQK